MMFSSMNAKLVDLEKRVVHQESRGSHLEKLLTDEREDSDRVNCNCPDECNGNSVTDKPSADRALLRLQGKVKETSFKLNALASKITRQDSEIDKLRNVVNGSQQQSTSDQHRPRMMSPSTTSDLCGSLAVGSPSSPVSTTVYNPLAAEFRPSWQIQLGSLTTPSPVEFTYSPFSTPKSGTTDQSAFSPTVSTYTSAHPGSYSPSASEPTNQRNERYSTLNPIVDVELTTDCLPDNNASMMTPSPRDLELSQGSHQLVEEVNICKRRIRDLETELHKKDSILQGMAATNEQWSAKEKELSQKQEWFEHKMRLLKQDKRRRGETIGKLLRCIDDMKDQGRVDESRVTEGRYVLRATLASRGWPPEDRVHAAVQAMEIERAALRAQIEAENAAAAQRAEEEKDPDACASPTKTSPGIMKQPGVES